MLIYNKIFVHTVVIVRKISPQSGLRSLDKFVFLYIYSQGTNVAFVKKLFVFYGIKI